MSSKIYFLFTFIFACCFTQAVFASEVTLSIIKPNAVEDQHIGDILQRFESQGLEIVGMKMVKLSKQQAEKFYAVHKERPFYRDLVAFMTSGPVVVVALEGDHAVTRAREIMGSTDPAKAPKGTIRADFGANIQENAVHGSDSLENAREEVRFFFKSNELFSNDNP
ncbi:MAG: nucleoside-diphosphate kinase [Chlamydiales bacterium]